MAKEIEINKERGKEGEWAGERVTEREKMAYLLF